MKSIVHVVALLALCVGVARGEPYQTGKDISVVCSGVEQLFHIKLTKELSVYSKVPLQTN